MIFASIFLGPSSVNFSRHDIPARHYRGNVLQRLRNMVRRLVRLPTVPPETSVPGALKPILVTGAGRNGSAALMGLLYLSYLAQLASVIAQPFRGPEEEWDRSALVTGRSSVLGPIPFDTGGYLGRDRLGRAAFPALWRDEILAGPS